MMLSRERLQREAANTGFRAESLEKVIQLVGLLNAFQRHPYLRDRLALKGGTALNLFIFELPRLSVDIDLNYLGAADREAMLEERPHLDAAMGAVFEQEGFLVRKSPTEHAGGKWQLRYTSALGTGANLEVDLNYMFRVPLWPVIRLDSFPVGSFRAEGIPVLDCHELAAGKLIALMDRHTSRDLFDAHALLTKAQLDKPKLRTAFTVYSGMSRNLDLRRAVPDQLTFDLKELDQMLLPLLRGGVSDPSWTTTLLSETQEALGALLPLQEGERAFLDALLDHGVIESKHLTLEEVLRQRIQAHPLLQWKAMNVRMVKGLASDQPDSK